jgi:hypothetical protein
MNLPSQRAFGRASLFAAVPLFTATVYESLGCRPAPPTSVTSQPAPATPERAANSPPTKEDAAPVDSKQWAIVDPEIEASLKDQEFVRVIVSIRHRGAPFANVADALEDELLATLNEHDFRLTHKMESVPKLTGDISISGLRKLRTNPDVLHVHYGSRRKHLIDSDAP